jgi:hypothetical protein
MESEGHRRRRPDPTEKSAAVALHVLSESRQGFVHGYSCSMIERARATKIVSENFCYGVVGE